MKTKLFRVILFAGVSSLLFSCVPASKFEQVKKRKARCEEANSELRAKIEEVNTRNNELSARMIDLEKSHSALVQDTAIKGNAYRTLTSQYDKINQLYSTLLENTDRLRSGADAESQKTLAMLQATRDELQRKEDKLRKLEESLNKERSTLEGMRSQIEQKETELNKKNAQVQELQAVLNRKDSVVNALRNKVSDALLGFEGEGLTVSKKNGKVYVSLEEQLLFQSGKWTVDPKGKQALKQLSNVLVQNKDINVMIEGHTDDVPYNGKTGIKDNWDLSVKRATSIVKILLQNPELEPQRLIPSGRGEFLPIDPAKTSEARKKNRRTEIILTPKLNELFDILENN